MYGKLLSMCKKPILIFNEAVIRGQHSDELFSIYFRCDFDSIGGRALIERMKFNILEIQENFENFLDKKEMTFEVSYF